MEKCTTLKRKQSSTSKTVFIIFHLLDQASIKHTTVMQTVLVYSIKELINAMNLPPANVVVVYSDHTYLHDSFNVCIKSVQIP